MQRNPIVVQQAVIGRHMNAIAHELIATRLIQRRTYFSCASPARGARTGKVPAQYIGITFVHRRSDVIEFGDEGMLEPIHKCFREEDCNKWLVEKCIEYRKG